MSFVPEINPCSREIVRIRNSSKESAKSPYNRHCESHQILLLPNSNQKRKHDSSTGNLTVSKPSNYTFHPKISKKSKEMAKNLPTIEERLQRFQDKSSNKKKTSKMRLSPHKINPKENLKN